jgi:hypothetical protein
MRQTLGRRAIARIASPRAGSGYFISNDSIKSNDDVVEQ